MIMIDVSVDFIALLLSLCEILASSSYIILYQETNISVCLELIVLTEWKSMQLQHKQNHKHLLVILSYDHFSINKM